MFFASLDLRRSFVAPAAAGILFLGLTACGSSESDADSASTATSDAAVADDSVAPEATEPSGSGEGASTEVVWTVAPDGYLEAGGTELPDSYPDPTAGPGEDCLIGYITPTNAIPEIATEIAGAESVAAEFGCTMVVIDGQFNPQNQVTGMQSLLGQGAAAIIVNPLDMAALAAPILQANEQGVPVVAVDSPASPTEPNVGGVATTSLQSRDVIAYSAAKAIADAQPDAVVGLLYPAFPAGNLQYQVERFRFWAEELGLTVADEADIAADDPDTVSEATASMLQNHPEITAVMAFNDTAAAAAVAAARTLGREGIIVTGIGGEDGVRALLEDGSVLMTWAYDNARMGQQAAKAAINAANGVEIPEKVTAPGAIITAANIAAFGS